MALAEPACPVCYEPYITDIPEEENELDTRPVLLPGGSSKCLFCCHEVRVQCHNVRFAPEVSLLISFNFSE